MMQGWIVEPEDFSRIHVKTLKASEVFIAPNDFPFGVIPICVKCQETGRVLWNTDMTDLEFRWMTNTITSQTAFKNNRYLPLETKSSLLKRYVVKEMAPQWECSASVYFIDLE